MLIRSQARNQRSADRTARAGDQNSHRASLSARFAATQRRSFGPHSLKQLGILSAASLAIGVRPTSRLLALKPGGKGQTTAEPPSVAQNLRRPMKLAM